MSDIRDFLENMRRGATPRPAPKPVKDGRLSTPYGATFFRKGRRGSEPAILAS